MKPIFLVAPMPDAYDKALELIREKGYDNIEVELANMGDGVAAARRAIRAGAEIIVTRGGTYRLCRAAFDLPVVEIHVSAYDIPESVQRAGAVEGPVAGVGYNNVVDGFDLLRCSMSSASTAIGGYGPISGTPTSRGSHRHSAAGGSSSFRRRIRS